MWPLESLGKILFCLDEPPQKEPEHDCELSSQLANELPIGNQINIEDTQGWCNEDVQMEISGEEIIDMVEHAKDNE